MSLSIVTGVIGGNDVTDQWLSTTIANCTDRCTEVIIVSNGSTEAENAQLDYLCTDLGLECRILDYTEPLGTSGAFNVGIRAAKHDIIAVVQSDLLIHEPSWDEKILGFFEDAWRVGVVGFAGAKRVGRSDVYRTPYESDQLMRYDVYSSLTDWNVHGHHADRLVDVVALDGIVQIFQRHVYDQIGGYDERYFHHCYDLDFCLSAHFAGYHNYVFPIPCTHIGGQTVGRAKAYADMVEPRGGDAGIHAESHRLMYEKWQGKLPAVV